MASSIQSDLRDDIYRFAYDLVTNVAAVRKDIRRHAPASLSALSAPKNILFTRQHSDWIQHFLKTEKKDRELDEWIKGETNSYDTSELRRLLSVCKEHYIDVILPASTDDERGFICACARVAYVGAYFQKKKKKSDARNEAVQFIHEWVLSIPPSKYPFLAALDG